MSHGPIEEQLAAAQARIAELEQRVEEQRRQIEQARLMKQLVENAVDGISVSAMDTTIVFANPAWFEMSGYGESALSRKLGEFYGPEELKQVTEKIVPQIFAEGSWTGILRVLRPGGASWLAQISAFMLRDEAGEPSGLVSFCRDVTAQMEAKQQAMQQAQLIEAQRAELLALSTPLIPIADEVIAMPLIGQIDAARAQQMLETLLSGVVNQGARVAILDITGVKNMDAAATSALVDAGKAVGLLGAEVVLTGIGPEVARALVEQGSDLGAIVTRGTFEGGIAHALGRVGRGRSRR